MYKIRQKWCLQFKCTKSDKNGANVWANHKHRHTPHTVSELGVRHLAEP